MKKKNNDIIEESNNNKAKASKEEGNHYYFYDNNNNEWQFLEINGSKKDFYFKCCTNVCKTFEMIERNDKDKKFRLRKEHNVD